MPQLSPKTTVISLSRYESHEVKHWNCIRILGSQGDSSDTHINPSPDPANARITNGITGIYSWDTINWY